MAAIVFNPSSVVLGLLQIQSLNRFGPGNHFVIFCCKLDRGKKIAGFLETMR